MVHGAVKIHGGYPTMTDEPLPDDVADAVVLRAMDWDKKDIADELDVHRNTVSRYLDRANQHATEGREGVVVVWAALNSTRFPFPKQFRRFIGRSAVIAGAQMTLDKLHEALPTDADRVDVEDEEFEWEEARETVAVKEESDTQETESETEDANE